MEEKNKQLLITDLCARLPYGVWVECCGVSGKLDNIWLTHFYNGGNTVVNVNGNTDFFHDSDYFDITKIKPYLRPMSSMTQEEIKKYYQLCETDDGDFTGEPLYFNTCESFDYLNSIHVDYRNFIQRGLALEAPEDMYKL